MIIIQTNILGMPTDVLTLPSPSEPVLCWEEHNVWQQNDEPELEPEGCDQWDYG